MNKILVIDDQKDNLTTIKAIVKTYLTDCLVITALSGQAGIAIAQKEQPDTILLDIIMPKMDGYEVCKILKENASTKHIPIVMITAIKTDVGSRVKGLESGADAFLSKPVDPIELSAQIKVMLRIKAAEDQLRKDKKELDNLVLEKISSLKESEQRFKDLVSMLPEAIFETDHNLNLTYVNQRALEITGYSQDDIDKGMNGFDFLIPEDRERAKQLFQNRKKGENPGMVQYTGLKKDGSLVNILFNANSVIKDGKLIGIRGVIVDITNRKKVEEALIVSEEKFRKAFETSPDSIVINRLKDGRYISINNGFTNIMGYTEKHILGKTSFELDIWYSPKDREELSRRLKKQGAVENFEAKFVTKNREVKDGLMSASLIDLEGIPHILSITRDISLRKQTLDALKHRESMLGAVFNSTGVGLLVVDNNRIITHKNDEFLRMWNIPSKLSESTDDKSLLKYVPQQLKDPEKFIAKIQKLYKSSKKSWDLIHFKDGRVFERNSQPLIVDKVIAGRVWGFRNITDRMRAEQVQKVLYNISKDVLLTDDLNKLIEFIRKDLGTLIDTTNFYVALYDEESDTFLLPFHSDQVDNFSSFPAGKSMTSYVFKTQKSLLATKKTKKKLIESGEIELFGADSEVWLGVPLKNAGKIIGVLAVQSYKDEDAYNESDMKMLEFVSGQISLSIDRKGAEDELKKALLSATESDRLKSAFLATMSHELRTPLNAIIGFSDIITDKLPVEEIVGFCKTINSSGHHLLSIVEDLFDITLIESGEIKIYKSEKNLHSVMKEVLEIIKIEQQKTNKTNIELNLKIPDENQNLTIYTDLSKLKQILINLLKNALKFTQRGQVTYGYCIKTKSGHRKLQFFVQDTGIGIPKEKQGIIFDLFRQADETHTRNFGGTGIGLSISKKLAKFLGGEMWLESETNKGTTFYFTIPLKETKLIAPSIIEKTKTKTGHPNKTILIAEDDESSFEYLNAVLVKANYHIIWAKNGEEAVNLCQKHKSIALVLMDINMPMMNGYEATKLIKKSRPDLPVIAQTAYAIAGDREKAFAEGCDDYISKPIKREELLKITGKYISEL